MRNPQVGKLVLERRYAEALGQILESAGAMEGSPKAQEALKLAEQGEYLRAARALPAKFGTEKHILKGLHKRVPAQAIFGAIRRESRTMYTHSYQSMLFNDALAERLERGVRAQEYTTDSEWVGGITSEEKASDEVRVTSEPDISRVVIPLFPKDEIGEEAAKAAAEGPDGTSSQMKKHHLLPKGGYRKAVVLPRNVSYTLTPHADAQTLSLRFDLPPGAYATMLVKEITKNGAKEAVW